MSRVMLDLIPGVNAFTMALAPHHRGGTRPVGLDVTGLCHNKCDQRTNWHVCMCPLMIQQEWHNGVHVWNTRVRSHTTVSTTYCNVVTLQLVHSRRIMCDPCTCTCVVVVCTWGEYLWRYSTCMYIVRLHLEDVQRLNSAAAAKEPLHWLMLWVVNTDIVCFTWTQHANYTRVPLCALNLTDHSSVHIRLATECVCGCVWAQAFWTLWQHSTAEQDSANDLLSLSLSLFVVMSLALFKWQLSSSSLLSYQLLLRILSLISDSQNWHISCF